VAASHADQVHTYLQNRKRCNKDAPDRSAARKAKKDWAQEDPILKALASAYWGIRVWLSDYLPNSDKCHRTESRIQQSLHETLHVLYQQFLVGKGEAFLKEHQNWLVCEALNDLKHPEVGVPPLFYGVLRRRINLRLRRASEGSAKCIEMFYTFQQTKRVWQRLPDALESAALQKHATRLGTDRGELPEGAYRRLEAAMNVVVPEGTVYTRASICPTYSACYEAGRARGGNRVFLAGDQRGRTVEGGMTESCYKLDDAGRPLKERIVPTLLSAVPAIESQEELEFCWLESMEYFGWDRNLSPKTIYSSILKDPELWTTRMKVVSLPEPGKFRILSKGPGAIYTGVRGLQGFLLDLWKKTTYSTMVDDLDALVMTRMTSNVDHTTNTVTVSADYTASTDLLNSRVSTFLMRRILKRLNLDGTKEGCLALLNFGKSVLEYPDGKVVEMTNGQLMGCPLSFPLLCIANLSTIIDLGWEVHASALINGDDLLFNGRLEDADEWENAATEIGL